MPIFDSIEQTIGLPNDRPEPELPMVQPEMLETKQSVETIPVPEVVVQQVYAPVPPKIGMGNPLRKGSLLSPEQTAKIKSREMKREIKRKTNLENKKLLAEQAEIALNTQPICESPICETQIQPVNTGQWKPGQTGNPAGSSAKKRHVKEALERVIVQAKAINAKDPTVTTRLENLMSKIYTMAMANDAEPDIVIEAAKFISERLEGRPVQEVTDSEGGSSKPELTININATRFALQPSNDANKSVLDVG